MIVEFCTASFSTGAATNADSLPTGVLAHNGVDDGAVLVTVANIDTGRYTASFSVPGTYAVGDTVSLAISATVGAVAGKAIVWQDTLDKAVNAIVDSNNRVDLGKWVGNAPDALSTGKVAADLKLWLSVAPLALSSQQVQAIVAAYAAGQDPATLVLDVAAASHETAGTIGAAISAGGTGGIVSGYTSGQDPATLVLDALAADHDLADTIGEAIALAAAGAVPIPADNAKVFGYSLGLNGEPVNGRTVTLTLITPPQFTGDWTIESAPETVTSGVDGYWYFFRPAGNTGTYRIVISEEGIDTTIHPWPASDTNIRDL